MAMLECVVNTFLQNPEEGERQCFIQFLSNSLAIASYWKSKLPGAFEAM